MNELIKYNKKSTTNSSWLYINNLDSISSGFLYFFDLNNTSESNDNLVTLSSSELETEFYSLENTFPHSDVGAILTLVSQNLSESSFNELWDDEDDEYWESYLK